VKSRVLAGPETKLTEVEDSANANRKSPGIVPLAASGGSAGQTTAQSGSLRLKSRKPGLEKQKAPFGAFVIGE
jgi:hypothetical protein